MLPFLRYSLLLPSTNSKNGANRKRVIEYEGLKVELSQEQLDNQKWVDIAVFEGSISFNNSYKLLRVALNKFFKWDKDIILGLENLQYINAVGIGLLFAIAYNQKDHDKRLMIGGKNSNLDKVFDLLCLPPEMLFFKSLDAAKRLC